MWGLWKKNYGEYGDYGNYRNYGESNYGNYKFLFRFVAQKHFSKKEKLQKNHSTIYSFLVLAPRITLFIGINVLLKKDRDLLKKHFP